MALYGVSAGMMSSYNSRLNWYAAAAEAVCVVPPPAAHAPTHVT